MVRGKRDSGGINAPRRKNGDINWPEVYNQHLIHVIRGQRAPNTARGLMYILLGKEVLKKSDYNALDKHLTKWRLDGYIGWNQIADGSGRGILGNYSPYGSPENWVNGQIDLLKNAGKRYRELLNTEWKWFAQPNYVIFMSEKHAVTGTVGEYLKDKYINIAYNRGNNGWGFAYRFTNFLRPQLYYTDIKTGERKKRNVYIWYLGDNDVYGLRMDREIRGQLSIFGMGSRVTFKRIAVTSEQIEEFNLPTSFDEEKGYEIDSLNAYNPDAFERLLLEHVDPYFDEDIHKKVLKKFTEKRINDMVRGKVKFQPEKKG